MAAQGEHGAEAEADEYESDPEDAPLPSMRRREASDDEDAEGVSDGGRRPVRKDHGSDGEADWQGAPQVYDDEEDEDDEVYYDEEEDDELGEEEAEDELVEGEGADEGTGGEAASMGGVPKKVGEKSPGAEAVLERSIGDEVEHEEKQGEVEEKKEKEAYAVPTAGAFYMHDDRFQESGRGRRRRMFGGRKLWDSKDEHAWVHDRFEEMNLQDDKEKQRSRGRFRGRGQGRSRGGGRGFARGTLPHKYYDDGSKQNSGSIAVKGRGPTHYDSITRKVRDIRGPQQKQSTAKSQETASNVSTGRQPSQATNAQPDTTVPRKHVFASSLNYASPPFYPSGSSTQESLTQKRDTHPVNTTSKTLPYSVQMDGSSMVPQSTSLLRGKAVIDSVDNDKSYMGDGPRYASGKSLGNSYPHSSGFSSSSTSVVQPSNSRVQGRVSNADVPSSNQHISSLGQVGRSSGPSIQGQTTLGQQRPIQIPVQSALQISTQQLVQRPGSGNQSSSPPSMHSPEVEAGSPKSKNSLATKGKTGQGTGSGRGTFLYGGPQVIGANGAMGLVHGDQNFPGTPALLPVMQFGGQHPGGLGVPAMGMALPGYVAQPQLGFGNSEMTWVPVLAGAAGPLGGSYPYITLDGSYYARPSGQSSSSIPARDISTNKQTASKPSQAEIVNDELAQRQNKPRRYSEMNFGQ